ncbi:MAG: hypothetical protein V2A34_01760 [Lentisphaerota bacterium]
MKTPDKPLEELPQEMQWKLERMDGYLDLKMTRRARQELESFAKEHMRKPPVLEIQLRLAMLEEDWQAAMNTARDLCAVMPNEPMYWVQLAYSTRRLSNLEDARTILLDAYNRFKKVAVIPYNLACYECQLGHRDEALIYLKRAFKLDRSFSEIAMEDEDLMPVWSDIDLL